MDPAGPWSYASYNRLPGVQASATGDSNTQLTQSGTPVTTAQIVSAGFLPSAPVSYDAVFNPLFHPTGSKPPVHYVAQVAQSRQPVPQSQAGASPTKLPTGAEYQNRAYFEQAAGGARGAWQQNSPFGVLPHESITPTTTASKTTIYEGFNAQVAAAQNLNQMNTHLAASGSKGPIQSVQANQSVKSTSQPTSVTFFQTPITFPNANANTKTFAPNESLNLQQSCIVTSSSNISRVPQSANRSNFQASGDKQMLPQIQTKAQTKIYPDLSSQADRPRQSQHDDTNSQSSPVGFSVNYANNVAAKRTQFQSSNYRHYQPGNNTEGEYQHTKSSVEYNSNGSDCRQASPMQTHSQSSPLGHPQSPAYPMYHSPMNSVPSPQQTSTNRMTSSPLDATISRPNSQSGNVAYPSVITRTLNTDKKYPDHYDRPIPPQQLQDCWDDRQTQQRKFQGHYLPAGNLEMASQRNPNIQERQQFYNASSAHQVSLQDPRGNPISLVKTLQHQQQQQPGCQSQQLNVNKLDTKVTKARRKSNEKMQQPQSTEIIQGSVMPEYFAGRIPPPAHTSVTNQQQNGTYYEFDRWNLPPSKTFGAQQHQGMMMTHQHSHHPPPPMSYFPPFHLPPHSDYPTGVELTPGYTEQPHQQNLPTPITEPDDAPKVVVPNIEEELGFLSGGTTVRRTSNASQPTTPAICPPIVNQAKSNDKTSGGAGFMNSYLKFLQGEREVSPPPTSRNGRKQSWSRSKPVQTNGIVTTALCPPIMSQPPYTTPPVRLSQGDPQDDPRYFPLPKERTKNHFGSSDDGFTSDDDLFAKKFNTPKSSFGKEKAIKKIKTVKQLMATVNVNRRPPKKAARNRRRKDIDEDIVSSIVPENLPRRESSRRAAKEKSNMRKLIAEEEMDHLDYMDSDSDPAWSPKRNEDDDVVAVMRKGRKVAGANKRKLSHNLISNATQGAGIHNFDGYINDGAGNKIPKDLVASPMENNVLPTIVRTNASQNSTEHPFKHGDFIALKTDLAQEWPSIWRVDGKALLQRFEPFEQNDQTLYKNVQTYTAWTSDTIKQYISVPTIIKIQNSSEVIVEFLRKEVISGHELGIIDKSMEGTRVYQDNFEVYIQTLISQALDSNFLTEIFQEQDEYFLTNVKTIDDITDNQKHKMVYFLQWPKGVLISITTWPCYNIINEFNASNSHIRPCAGCLRPGISVRILLYGQPYNFTTLEVAQPDPYITDKDFFMCRTCASRVELFNKVTHQKYLMFIRCAKKVAEKRNSDPNKDTTCILNELLADESWLNELFKDVRYAWGEIDCLEYRYQLNNQCSDSSNTKDCEVKESSSSI